MLELSAKVGVDPMCSCAGRGCVDIALSRYDQLHIDHYSRGVSVLEVPETLDDWLAAHRTARKRAARSQRLGYRFDRVDYSQHSDDIFEINTSVEMRQGRPMSAGYREWRQHSPLPTFPCDQHYTRTYGVLERDRLRAYLTLHRSGVLAMVSMILGHHDHQPNDIMYLLFRGVVEDQ